MSKATSTPPRSAHSSPAKPKSARSGSATQSSIPQKRCARCGAKAVKPRTGPGRTTRYRTMPTLAIPEDVVIPACGRCHSEYLDEESALALQPQLQKAYLDALRVRIRLAIDLLSEHVSQRRLEQLLGLSQGYLSRLRAGAGNPSPELVSHLALLSQDPEPRLAELERFWALPDDNWHTPMVREPRPSQARAPVATYSD